MLNFRAKFMHWRNINDTYFKRLDQALSNSGYCSRREVRILDYATNVRNFNGELAKSSQKGRTLTASLVDHQHWSFLVTYSLWLNKPRRLCMQSWHSMKGQAIIYGLIYRYLASQKSASMSVGRLDKDTTAWFWLWPAALVQQAYINLSTCRLRSISST